MQTMHIFAGAGGGLLADLILGHTPAVAVEWEPYACQVLRERAAEGWFPDLSVWEGDVRMFDPSEYEGRVDCIHAGFPCQDISTAGKQAGIAEGTRSGLYREVLRIGRIVRPQFIYLENVAAITSKGLEEVVKDLAQMGYDGRWCCLRASDVGANHHRDRWWGLFRNTDYSSESTCSVYDEAQRMSKSRGINVTNSDSTQCEGGSIPRRGYSQHANIILGSWWKNKPGIHGVDDGMASRMDRLKAIGNGQVPLQAAVAFKILSKGWV